MRRPTLVARAAQPSVELTLNRALADQRPQPRQLRQRLARVIADSDGKQRLKALVDELDGAGYTAAAKCLRPTTSTPWSCTCATRSPTPPPMADASLSNTQLAEVKRRTKVIGRFPASPAASPWSGPCSISASPAPRTASASANSNANAYAGSDTPEAEAAHSPRRSAPPRLITTEGTSSRRIYDSEETPPTREQTTATDDDGRAGPATLTPAWPWQGGVRGGALRALVARPRRASAGPSSRRPLVWKRDSAMTQDRARRAALPENAPDVLGDRVDPRVLVAALWGSGGRGPSRRVGPSPSISLVLRGPLRLGSSSCKTATADVVGHVHVLVGARVRAPAAREGAVFAPGAGEGRVQRAVRHGDSYGVALELPPVGQRGG